MIRIEISSDGTLELIGTLEASALRTLLEGANGRGVRLDLSEIRAAQGPAVRILAESPPGALEIVACPQWLEIWIENERLSAIPDAAPP